MLLQCDMTFMVDWAFNVKKVILQRLYSATPKSISKRLNCRSTLHPLYHICSFQTLHTSSMEQLDLVSSLTTDHHHPCCPHLISCVQTNTGCGLVGQSQGSLCVFRVFNARDESLQLSPSFVVQMLEYTMFVGYDVWDVLLAVRQGKAFFLFFFCTVSPSV